MNNLVLIATSLTHLNACNSQPPRQVSLKTAYAAKSIEQGVTVYNRMRKRKWQLTVWERSTDKRCVDYFMNKQNAQQVLVVHHYKGDRI